MKNTFLWLSCLLPASAFAMQPDAGAQSLQLLAGPFCGLLALVGIAVHLYRRTVTRLEAEHREALAAAEVRSRQDKVLFVANMSRELRTPLNAMLGFSRLLARDTSLPAATRDDLAIVVGSSEQLLALLEKHLNARFGADTPRAPQALEIPLAPERVAGLPGELRTRLDSALLRLEVDAIDDAVAALRVRDPVAGDALHALAERFDYERMRRLLEEARQAESNR